MREGSAAPASLPQRCLERLDTPWVPWFAALLMHALLVWGYFEQKGWGPGALPCAGDRFCDPGHAPPGLLVLRGSDGFDGQFYYRLALDPFTSRRTDFGITFDTPAYRHQRIGFPLVVWALAGGNAAKVPVLMLTVNLLALSALGWFGGLLAREAGRHALWGLLFPFYPGFALVLLRDTAEIQACFLLLAGILSLRRRAFGPAAVWLVCAVLTRETTAFVCLAGLAILASRALRGCVPSTREWVTFGLPVLVLAVWQTALFHLWGGLSHDHSSPATGWPLAGFLGFVRSIVPPASGTETFWLEGVILFAWWAAAGLRGVGDSRASGAERVAWVAYLFLALSFSPGLWNEDWNFLRVMGEYAVLGGVLALSARARWVTWCAGIWQAFLWARYFDRFVDVPFVN